MLDHDSYHVLNSILPFRYFLHLERKREKVIKAWSNPMSIYGPDPVALEVCFYNCGLRERSDDLRISLDCLRQDIDRLKQELSQENELA